MEYLLLIYKENEDLPEEGTADHESHVRGHRELYKDLCRKDQYIGSNALEKIANTTTVRLRSEKVEITDGPFAETREQLAGYYLIDCDNLDEAIAAAARIPDAAHGSIEVRPVQKWEPERIALK